MLELRMSLSMTRGIRLRFNSGQKVVQDLAVQIREVGWKRLADQITDKVERSILFRERPVVEPRDSL